MTLLKNETHLQLTLKYMCDLANIISHEPIKRDVLLVTMMRYVIEVGMTAMRSHVWNFTIINIIISPCRKRTKIARLLI